MPACLQERVHVSFSTQDITASKAWHLFDRDEIHGVGGDWSMRHEDTMSIREVIWDYKGIAVMAWENSHKLVQIEESISSGAHVARNTELKCAIRK